MISDGTSQSFDIHCLSKRYRHEFGVGIGGGVYFWKVFGLYAEVLVGQYSYFPELFDSYYTARIGVELKFMPNKKAKKIKNKEMLPGHKEYNLVGIAGKIL